MNKPKFRAWDWRSEKMYEVVMIDFIKKVVCVIESEKNKICRWIKFRDIILMQYTGIKDKNGVEIYEGDICEWHIPDMGRPEPDAMIRYVSVVEYRKGSFNLSGYLFPNVRLIQVLGSIHENPELLNEVE